LDPLIKSQLLYQLSYAPEPIASRSQGWVLYQSDGNLSREPQTHQGRWLFHRRPAGWGARVKPPG
jgi:hypothetical protein